MLVASKLPEPLVLGGYCQFLPCHYGFQSRRAKGTAMQCLSTSKCGRVTMIYYVQSYLWLVLVEQDCWH